jgi:hypothetical protein
MAMQDSVGDPLANFVFFKQDPVKWKVQKHACFDEHGKQQGHQLTADGVLQMSQLQVWLQSSVTNSTWSWIKPTGPKFFQSAKTMFYEVYACSL